MLSFHWNPWRSVLELIPQTCYNAIYPYIPQVFPPIGGDGVISHSYCVPLCPGECPGCSWWNLPTSKDLNLFGCKAPSISISSPVPCSWWSQATEHLCNITYAPFHSQAYADFEVIQKLPNMLAQKETFQVLSISSFFFPSFCLSFSISSFFLPPYLFWATPCVI